MGVYIRVRDTGKGRRFDVAYRKHGRYGRIEHAGTFKTRREADLRRRVVEDWLAKALDPKVQLAHARSPGVTFREVADEWLAGKRRIRETTRVEYTRRAGMLKAAFGDMPVEAISVRDINRWIDGLTHRPSTIGEYVTVLRSILDHAGVVNVARDRRVELPKRERRVVEPPDAERTLAVLAHVKARYLQPCLVMEQCGLRVSEASDLQPRDLDLERGRLLVRQSKTGRPRWVPVPAWLLDRLAPPYGVNRRTVLAGLAAGARDGGVPKFSPHMLRHRRASLWHLQGVAPVQAADWLGHSVKEYLETYSHVMPVEEIDAHRLAALL